MYEKDDQAGGGFAPDEAMAVDDAMPMDAAPAPQPKSSETTVGGSTNFNPFKKGKILYSVPANMKLNEAARCRVRIAFEELTEALLKEREFWLRKQ
jgi:hypothetical protein